jgi:subtilisin family serine protease
MVLKVLNRSGHGRISNVIAALEYIAAHKDDFNIRIVNLSIATGVYESYHTDPLTLAAKRLVEKGVVVVAAAGNAGRDRYGNTQYGGTTSPGNAPWVLTVGASSHMGTIDRSDDTIAPFSSRGPTAVDRAAKPDLVAPGVGIESLSVPNSLLYESKSSGLLYGTEDTWYPPYLSLTGTSQSAPVVAGTVALMLQANPGLTPNAVKAILQYTAEYHLEYDPVTQGAGFLNAHGAVALAHFYASPGSAPPSTEGWGGRLIWGEHVVSGGWLDPTANAWATNTVWGDPFAAGGDPVEWGDLCLLQSCDLDPAARTPWGATDTGDTVVWGTTYPGDTVVWGTTDTGETVVWGTTCEDPSCDPPLWSSQ